jgi:hypothetical protein
MPKANLTKNSHRAADYVTVYCLLGDRRGKVYAIVQSPARRTSFE